MQRCLVDLGAAAASRKLLCGGDRFSRLDRQPVEVHLVLWEIVALAAVEHDLTLVLLVHIANLPAQLALEPLEPRARLPELVLEADDRIDTGEVCACRWSGAG